MEGVKIKPDEVLFNSLLDGCCRIGLIDVGLMVYRNMIREKIKPSNVTFSILIKIYGKAGDLKRALGVFEEMKKLGVQPGLIVYTCIIQTCIRQGDVRTAQSIYNDMTKSKGIKGDQLTYSTLINGWLQNQESLPMEEVRQQVLQLIKESIHLKLNFSH